MDGGILVIIGFFVLLGIGGYLYERDAHAYMRRPQERIEPK